LTSAELIAIAAAEVGYLEKASNDLLDDKASNAGKNNCTKYSRDLHTAGYYNGNKQGYAWCNVFVDWCFYMAAHEDKSEAQFVSCQSGKLGAVCTYSAGYYKSAKRFDKTPSVGAQIYFTGTGTGYAHTGLVESVDSSYVYTIEGNASNSVMRKKYARNNTKIAGYGHPLYDDDESCRDSDPADTTPTERTDSTLVQITTFKLRMGSKGNAVQTLQALLNHWSGAELEIDGSFGQKTEQAVRKYQESKSLEVDGVVGKKTWSSLLN